MIYSLYRHEMRMVTEHEATRSEVDSDDNDTAKLPVD